MGLLSRAIKVARWLAWGKDTESRAKVISFLEMAIKEGKNVELVGGKEGITLRFRKEF